MSDNILVTILSGIGGVLLLLFGITSKKLDKADFDKHCERQGEVNDKFEKTIQENTVMLARVEERLREK